MFDWLIFRIPGWNRKVRKLRRDWDRAREESLKKKGKIKRMILEKLDIIEKNLRLLEEERLSRLNRRRMAKEIELDLSEIKIILKAKKEELRVEFGLERGNNKKQSPLF